MIDITSYSPIEKQEVLEILHENTPHYFTEEEVGDLIHYLDFEIEDYFVVKFEGKIIGSGGINYKENGTVGIISWDLISSKFQGMGIGSLLLSYRLDILQSKSRINKIIVRTTQLVYPFYEKHGFELIKTEKNYWGKGFDLYHMEINIS
jgi:N-acetylglutamate synthase-like GNAT family acetyltransferase